MPTEPDTQAAAALAVTTRDWARAVYRDSGLAVPPEHLERVFTSIVHELLDLARSEPFPVSAARTVGRRLAEEPFDRMRMLAPATRALLGFAPGDQGSLVATRWPFVASHAIDAYAEELQQRALAQQKHHLNAAVTVRVQEIAQLQIRLQHEATHDALTDLANRSLLQERVRLMATDRNCGVGLLLIDLDDFKLINDRFGHTVGDEVLVEISRRLRTTGPSDTVVCRYGGDEFVLALPIRRNLLAEVAMRVLTVLTDPVDTRSGPVPVSASVGTAFCPPGRPCDFSDLLRSADRAMYTAKTAGKRCFALAEPDEAVGDEFPVTRLEFRTGYDAVAG